MRKSDSQRFPTSASLFRFCFRVLESQRPDGKVHDQEVGNILDYNPSDTSHWKRGKKSVKSIYALETLGVALNTSLETLEDLAEGVIDLEEAWFEHTEAEETTRLLSQLDPAMLTERVKRRRLLEQAAAQLLQEANIQTVPVFLPELLSVLPFIQLQQGDVAEKLVRTSRLKPGLYSIRYRKGELRAHVRAAIAREIAKIVVYSERTKFGLPERIDSLTFFEIVDFSNALLVPKTQLAEEVKKISARVNLVKALSHLFWTPKSMIRQVLSNAILDVDTSHVIPPIEIRPAQSYMQQGTLLPEMDRTEALSDDS